MGDPKLVPAVAPDGTPIMVPESGVAALVEARGRPISNQEMAAEQANIAKRDQPFDPADIPETWLAGQHAYIRGATEAIGVPLDAGITGVAGLFGDESQKATSGYLRSLNEKHPYVSGALGLAGNVAGTLGAAEALGLPTGLSNQTPGIAGAAARMATGGVENVVQATTRDINESALGDAKVNGDKIYANIPKHFLTGFALMGLGEGVAAGLGAGAKALSKKAPALEARAWDYAARDAGTTGAELSAIAERRGAEMPRSADELASFLEAEQGALRGEQAAAHAGKVGALTEAQAAERATFDASRQARRAGVMRQGVAGIADTEATAANDVLEAMARGGERVEAAELAGAAKRAPLENEALRTGLQSELGRMSAAARIEEAEAAAARQIEGVNFKYDLLRKTLGEEKAAAAKAAEDIASQRESVAKELAEAAKAVREEGHAPPGKITPQEFDEMLDTYLGVLGRKRDPSTRWAAEEHLRKIYGADIVETAELAGAGPGAQVQRLEAMASDLEKAHKAALGEIGKVDKAGAALEVQHARALKEAQAAADKALTGTRRVASQEAQRAAQVADVAMGELRKAEAVSAKTVEAARAAGAGEAKAAEKAAKAQVEAARSRAEAAIEAFDRLAAAEEKALAKTQRAAMGALGEAPTETAVDPLVATVRKAQEARAGVPMVSASWGDALSLLRGHPFGLAASLASSFASGRVRAQGNWVAARTLKALADQLSSFDVSIARGVTRMLSEGTASGSRLTAPVKLPSFEVVAKNVREAQANPDLVRRSVEAQAPWAAQAPSLYAATLATAMRAQDFLASKLPPDFKDSKSLTPHLLGSAISDTAKYDFMQYVQTIADPRTVFRDVVNGKVTDAQVEALGAVYPPLYDEIKQAILHGASQRTKPLPYDREIHVGQLLGIETNEVQDRDFQKTLAASYDEKAEEGAPMPGSKGGGSNKGVSQNMMSTSQRVEGGDY